MEISWLFLRDAGSVLMTYDAMIRLLFEQVSVRSFMLPVKELLQWYDLFQRLVRPQMEIFVKS